MNDGYIFSNHDDRHEHRRLQMLEQVHDPRTIGLLDQAGLKEGQVCAEVGAGAGSIARHLALKVGKAGRVVAVDLDPRFLLAEAGDGLEVRATDIATPEALELEAYDLIHARFVLVHLPDPRKAIEVMAAALKPGGVLLLEEPDFRTAFSAAANPAAKASTDAVNRAICKLYVETGKDPGFGGRLPALAQQAGLDDVTLDVHTLLVPGGEPIALMMAASVSHLGARLIATGEAASEDIERYCAAAADPAAWASYYSTVSMVARRPSRRPRDLADVRGDIDAVDRRLVRLIAARSVLVAEAGSLKKSKAEVPAPARVEQVIAKTHALAAEFGAPEPVVDATYRAMISAFIDFEHTVRKD